jgi:hypothetical protein
LPTRNFWRNRYWRPCQWIVLIGDKPSPSLPWQKKNSPLAPGVQFTGRSSEKFGGRGRGWSERSIFNGRACLEFFLVLHDTGSQSNSLTFYLSLIQSLSLSIAHTQSLFLSLSLSPSVSKLLRCYRRAFQILLIQFLSVSQLDEISQSSVLCSSFLSNQNKVETFFDRIKFNRVKNKNFFRRSVLPFKLVFVFVF